MTEAILFILFLIITTYFGFTVSRFILNEKRVFALVPLSIILGLAAYNFLVNALSYAIPIRSTVFVLLILFLVISLLVSYIQRRKLFEPFEWVFTKKQYGILLGIAFLISLFSGIVAVKSLALDDMFVGHIPLAVTITQGNFPVMDPTAPDHVLSYHYAPDLLTACFNMIAGIPVWLGYDLQIFLFSGSLFLLLFLLVYEISGRYRASLIAAALFLYGTGLQWIYLFTEGLPAFWQRYILNENVPAFWKFLTDVAFPRLNTSFIFFMNNHSMALGIPLLVLVMLLYFRSLRADNKRQAIKLSVMAGLVYGYLALNLETYYVIAFLAFVTMVVVALLNKNWKWFGNVFTTVTSRQFFAVTAIVVVLGVTVALVQGGILSSLIKDPDRDKLVLVKSFNDFITLNFAPNPSQVDNSDTYIYLGSFDFFVQFGIPLLAIIPAIFYFFRKKNGQMLHLAIMATGAFLVPFLFRMPGREWEVSRFFTLAIPLFSLIVGYYFSDTYDRLKEQSSPKWKLFVVILLTVLVGLTGVMSQLLFSASNLDRFGQLGPLVMRPPEPSNIDAKAFSWIKENTSLSNDRFFPYDPEFIRFTGRFTPGDFPYFGFSLRDAEKMMYPSIVNNCSEEGLRFFKINYLYVTPQFPIKNYTQCLEKLNATPVYAAVEGDNFRVIYKIGK